MYVDLFCYRYKSYKVKKRIRKGIPDSLRSKVWPMLARIEEKKKVSNIDYQVNNEKTILNISESVDNEDHLYRRYH